MDTDLHIYVARESHLSHSLSTPRTLYKLTLPFSLSPLIILMLLIRSINLIILVQVLIGTSPSFRITNLSNKESKRLVNTKVISYTRHWNEQQWYEQESSDHTSKAIMIGCTTQWSLLPMIPLSLLILRLRPQFLLNLSQLRMMTSPSVPSRSSL